MDKNVMMDQRSFVGSGNETFVETQKKSTEFLNFMYLLKGFLGMGFYTIPYAMVHGHLTFVIGMIVFPICVHILVNVCQQMGGGLSYPETAEAVCLTCVKTRKYSTAACIIVKVFLILNTLFLCSLYLGFITSHVEKVISYNMGEYVNYYIWLVILATPLLGLCLLPILTSIAVAGVIFQLITILIFYGVFVVGDFPSEIGIKLDLFTHGLLRFIFSGLITTLLEGISIVLVVENKMKQPNKMIGCPSMLCTVMVIVVLLNIICALLAFLRFGSLTRPFITLSTPSYTILGQITLIFAALSIYLTYPIQFNVGFMVLWNYIESYFEQKLHKSVECILRIFFVIITIILALINPDFIVFHIVLYGGFILIFLGVIMPIFLQLCIWCYKDQNKCQFISLSICLILSCIFVPCIISITFYEYFHPKENNYGAY